MKIHSRSSWGARKPRPRTRQDPAEIRELFVHWNGDKPASFASVNTLEEEHALLRSTQAFHMGPQRGWSDFAYSFAIMPSGRVYRCRGLAYVPASQINHNTNTASVIVFLGPDDSVNERVKDAIRGLHSYVDRKSSKKVALRPHRAVTSTSCPGPRLTAFVNAN